MSQAIFHRETGEFLGELLADVRLPGSTHLHLPIPPRSYDPGEVEYVTLYPASVDIGIMHDAIAKHWILLHGTKEDLWDCEEVSPPAHIRGRMAR